jgi:hypothetical protein
VFGYIFTFLVGLAGAVSFAYMDLDAPSQFLRMFLPFIFVVCTLFCFVAFVSWVLWHVGGGGLGGTDSSDGWFCWGPSPFGGSSAQPGGSDSSGGGTGGDVGGSDS